MAVFLPVNPCFFAFKHFRILFINRTPCYSKEFAKMPQSNSFIHYRIFLYKLLLQRFNLQISFAPFHYFFGVINKLYEYWILHHGISAPLLICSLIAFLSTTTSVFSFLYSSGISSIFSIISVHGFFFIVNFWNVNSRDFNEFCIIHDKMFCLISSSCFSTSLNCIFFSCICLYNSVSINCLSRLAISSVNQAFSFWTSQMVFQ